MKTLTRLPLLLVLFSFIFSACEKVSVQNPEDESYNEELANLNPNYRKWKALGIKNYTVTETLGCFCLVRGDHDLTVVNNSIRTIKNSQGMAVAINNSGLKTIDELFEFIQKSLDQNPAISRITYDTTYGHPVNVYFDYNTMTADEEFRLALKNFKPTE
jgi:hypothetical protein